MKAKLTKQRLSRLGLILILSCASYSTSDGCSNYKEIGRASINCTIVAYMEIGEGCVIDAGTFPRYDGWYGCYGVDLSSTATTRSFTSYYYGGCVARVSASGTIRTTVQVNFLGEIIAQGTFLNQLWVEGHGSCCGSIWGCH